MFYPEEEKYVAEIEKSIYNVAIANQYGSEGIRYFAKLVDHKHKENAPYYHCMNTCCEGQGTRIYGSLPEYIYSVAEDGIYVDLYSASEIKYSFRKQSMSLKMNTQFPYDPKVEIVVGSEQPVQSKIRIRVPTWASEKMQIMVNGQTVGNANPGTYFIIDREWKNGDVVSFTLPMDFKVTQYTGMEKGFEDNHYAIEYGPILMAMVGVKAKKEDIGALLSLFIVLNIMGFTQQTNAPSLIPFPESLTLKEGHFRLSLGIQLVVNSKEKFGIELAYLQNLLTQILGSPLSSRKGENVFEITYSEQVKNEEGYSLDITPQKITILAQGSVGVFYAIQTLYQLVLLNKKNKEHVILSALSIKDEPAFAWRGSMIDVSRHFFSIDYLKQHIDRLAFYKMNKLHLHLTDDQGWRIEIKKYPKLTKESGFRIFNSQNSACVELAKTNPDLEIDPRYITKKDGNKIYGGYYTQDQLRDLVAYAAKRHIEIIPEIDMPGHMMAAISVYSELADGWIGWGEAFFTPICPCKDAVYSFIEDVIDEVASIFPSSYIHIGSDEVDKTAWKKSTLCRQFMVKENITDVGKLQDYFVQRILKIIESKGKKMICWDEVLDGRVEPSVNIMYWRGWVPDSPGKA